MEHTILTSAMKLTRRKVIIVCVVVFIIDSFILGSLILSSWLLFFSILYLLPIILWNMMKKNKSEVALRGIPFVFFMATVIAVIGVLMLHATIADKRAEKLITAIKAYKLDHSDYPVNLDALVPGYLSNIPLVKYCLTGKHFLYRYSSPGKKGEHEVYFPNLSYTKWAMPDGRPFYYFKQDKWTNRR